MTHPKDPDPSKVANLRTYTPLLCRFKPFHSRVQGFLGHSLNPHFPKEFEIQESLDLSCYGPYSSRNDPNNSAIATRWYFQRCLVVFLSTKTCGNDSQLDLRHVFYGVQTGW